jgi:hypothetical protein
LYQVHFQQLLSAPGGFTPLLAFFLFVSRCNLISYQTSGGTVLSTNWKEVSQADYEGKDKLEPPEGQEWRAWNKN